MPIVKIPLDVLAFSPKRVRLIPIKAMMSGSDDVFSCSVSEKLSFVDVLSNDDFSNAPWIIKINNININATTGTTFVGSTGGLFTLHEDQTISFDPQDDFDSLVYPNSRITAVSYVATDGIVTKYGTISVNVSSIEPVVLVAENDFGSTDTETTTSGNVLLNDDEELIEIVAVNGVSADIGLPVRGDAGGVFVIDYNGDWFFDPNDEFSGLSGEGTATTSIEYTASNGTGTTAEAVLTITISAVALPANTAPVALNDTGATTADATTSGNVLTNDTDADGDTLTVSQVAGSAANVGVAVAGSAGGLFTIASDGSWTFDPGTAFSGLTGEQTATTSVTYHASDGVAEAMGTLTVTVGSGVADPWTPDMIPGAVWVDADTVTLDGSAVTAMTDKVGGTIAAAQGTSSARPTLVADALGTEDVIQFDGGDWLSFGTQLGKPANWTVFAVGMFQAVNSAQFLCGSVRSDGATTTAWGEIGNVPTGKSEFQFGDGSAYRYGKTTASVFTAGAWFMECHTYSSGDALPVKHINGTAQSVVTEGGTATSCGGTAYEFAIGRFGAYAPGILAAGSRVKGVLVAPSVLSTPDRQKLEGYYAHRCGLTALLPSDHPYKSAAPIV